MTLKAYALTTVQRSADFARLGTIVSGSTKEAVLENLVNAVTEFIENYIGYRVKQTTYTNEEYDTERGDILMLKRFPVVSFAILERRNSSLAEDSWTNIGTEYYHVELDTGIVQGAAGWRFARTRKGYRVTYVAGFDFDNTATFLSDTEGGDLEMAAWLLITAVYNRRTAGGGIKSERIGDYSVAFAGSMFENEDIKAILNKYRKRDVGLSYLTPISY